MTSIGVPSFIYLPNKGGKQQNNEDDVPSIIDKQDDEAEQPTNKKAKVATESTITNDESNKGEISPVSTTVLTYEMMGGEDLKIILRPIDTLFDFCELLCNKWIADFRNVDYCNVNASRWSFTHAETNKSYHSPMYWSGWRVHPLSQLIEDGVANAIGSELKFSIDTTQATFRLISIQEDAALAAKCPDCIITPLENFVPHQPPSDLQTLDQRYPNLSEAMFGTVDKPKVPSSFFLFQPGRKNYHAFIQRGALIVWVPERLESTEKLFTALDQGCEEPLVGGYNWGARTIFPLVLATPRIRKRASRCVGGDTYGVETDPSKDRIGYFSKAFPKCNKAYTSKKAREKGWIYYKGGVLKLCRGKSITPRPTNAPEEFSGCDKFTPEEDSVVASMRKRFHSLQELFCAAEALWP